MKCDLCEQEATVHEVTIRAGKKVEKHLCEKCARAQGIAVQPHVPINELIQKYVLSHAGAEAPATPGTKPGACPGCGLTYGEFRQCGLLGCPDCYRAFESQLGPLLERAHEGGTHHVGKMPRRALASAQSGEAGPASPLGGANERAGRLLALHKQLDEAVRAEQYERAATLRDELRRLTVLDPEPGAPARTKPGGTPGASGESAAGGRR